LSRPTGDRGSSRRRVWRRLDFRVRAAPVSTPLRRRRLQLADRFLPVDERALTEALSIDRAAKIVRPRYLETGAETDERYDRLPLSPGAEVARPPIPAGEPKASPIDFIDWNDNDNALDRLIASGDERRIHQEFAS